MAVDVKMPQLSDTMDDGKILAWVKNEGDVIERGDTLAEVETDKADLEIESFHEGVLLKITAPVGETVRVGEIIAVIGEAGESIGENAKEKTPEKASEDIPPVLTEPPKEEEFEEFSQEQISTVEEESNEEEGSDRIKISPLARNIAKAHGVDIQDIRGSGEGGRIVKRDVEQLVAVASKPSLTPVASENNSPPTTPKISAPDGAASPLSKMRQTIADRMVTSVRDIPHFYVTSKIHVDELVKLRGTVKPLGQYEGVTYTHLIIKAVALALRAVPRINAYYENGNLVQPREINIGIITAVPDGLLIPVLKNADELSVADIVSEGRVLVNRARAGKPKPGDLVGGTFSISNVGLFAVESFTAIINPGQGAILAVSAIEEEPVVTQGQIVPGKVMRVTLSVDHRIIDGTVAGEFLTELKRLIEEPVLLLA